MHPFRHLTQAKSLLRRCIPAAMAVLLQADLLSAQNATILEIQNTVQTASSQQADWSTATPNQSLAIGDRIRTRRRSRATVALTGLYTVRIDQLTTLEMTPALMRSDRPQLDLQSGAVFIFSREKSGEIDINTPTVNAALRGTQLVAQVLPDGKSLIQVLEGQVDLQNPHGKLTLTAGEAAEAAPGRAPRKTAVIEARNLLQWALYYPAVLDPADLGLSPQSSRTHAAALAAYQRGNLLAAVKFLPDSPPADSPSRTFFAGVLLSVGRIDEAKSWLAPVPATSPGRRALDRMIAAVKLTPENPWPTCATASEALAESYLLQAHGQLAAAKSAAALATSLSPKNGYAWTRLGELEFSSGRNRAARTALETALALTPENARSHALLGFVLSGENRIPEAAAAFRESVKLDPAFGNGWLGLGLTKIKSGDLSGGRADLQTAATVEPTSSVFHSYLGKAFSMERRPADAAKDLQLARTLDPADPTPLLYSAIDHQLNYRNNAAIADLEKSIFLNDNRRLYRSQFLLDQDRAVRSANLAKIYQTAGMRDVALREATRAVESDYTNPSAHGFLANAFDAMRDPDRTLLRYETPWFNELLLSNLLAPVGGGPLSQFVSQQEYSKLLEADGVGGSITTEWRSTSEVRSTASAFATQGNFSYGIDAYYRNDDGDRLNSDLELRELYAQFKWQATPDDIFYFLGKLSNQDQGDLFESYDNQPVSPGMDFEENQHPGLLLGGWNHRWAPGSNTLLLLGRLAATQSLTDPATNQRVIYRDTNAMFPNFLSFDPNTGDSFTDPALANSVTQDPVDGSLIYSPALLQAIAPYIGSGTLMDIGDDSFEFATRREMEILSAEIQHILQSDQNTLLLGARIQDGTIETDTKLSVIRPTFMGGYSTPAVEQHVVSDYQRFGFYAYDYWSVLPRLTLIGGLSYDAIDHPENFRNPPVSSAQRDESQLSGKFGFSWAAADWFTLRGAATEGIGGLSFDESVRLEPAQLAGFTQAYRTVISESIAGSVETPNIESFGLAAEGKFPTRTWWGVSANLIDQEVSRSVGSFTGYDSGVFPSTPAFFPSQTREHLDYREQSLAFTLNQLVADEFSVGSTWRITRSQLDSCYPELVSVLSPSSSTATLNEISLFGNWISPSGWFSHLEANWFQQHISESSTSNATFYGNGDEFLQFNAWAGYRFNQNLCEIAAGVMNIGGNNYQLSPLNPHSEIARDRTFFITCRLGF